MTTVTRSPGTAPDRPRSLSDLPARELSRIFLQNSYRKRCLNRVLLESAPFCSIRWTFWLICGRRKSLLSSWKISDDDGDFSRPSRHRDTPLVHRSVPRCLAVGNTAPRLVLGGSDAKHASFWYLKVPSCREFPPLSPGIRISARFELQLTVFQLFQVARRPGETPRRCPVGRPKNKNLGLNCPPRRLQSGSTDRARKALSGEVKITW